MNNSSMDASTSGNGECGVDNETSCSSLQFRRRVSIREILSHDYKTRKPGDFVEVKILYSFFFQNNLRGNVECHFILADQNNYISGVLYGSSESHLFEVYNRLREGTIHRIKSFEVINAARRSQGPNFESNFLLRNQWKRLKLRNSVKELEEIPANVEKSFLNHIPFDFIRLDHVHNSRGKFVDILGFVKNVEDKVTIETNTPYKIVRLGMSKISQSSDRPMETSVFLFGRSAQKTINVGGLYAFLNILIKDNPMFGLSPWTTWRTIIIEVTKQNLTKIHPSILQNEELIMDVSSIEHISDYTQKLKEENLKHDSGCSGEEKEADKSLCRNFSQLSGLGRQSVTAQQSETLSRSQQLPVIITSTEIFYDVTPPPQESKSESPSKRSLLSCELTSNSPKKSRQSSSDEETEGEVTTMPIVSPTLNSNNKCPTSQRYDFDQDIPFKVDVTPATHFRDIGPNDYSMRSKIRGVALIINNFFDDTSLERQGSYFDVMYLTEYLTKCNFKVTTIRDLPTYQYKSAIRNFKEQIREIGPENFDCMVIAVFSHGTHGAIVLNDELSVPLYDDVIHPFDEYNFPILIGKPKVFIVQACQSLPSTQDLRFQRNVLTPPVGKKLKNMIVCYGTYPGSEAHRDIYLGSVFMVVLVDILMRHSHYCHFVEMLEMVQEALDRVQYDKNGSLTCTWNPYGFKRLYLNPCI